MNQLGGHYVRGRPLSRALRKQIIQLTRLGLRQCDISRHLKVTHGCISKLLTKFQETGELDSPKNIGRPRVVTAEIELKVKEYLIADPGIFCWEVRLRLLREGVWRAEEVPSLSSISRLIKRMRVMEAVAKMENKEKREAEERARHGAFTPFTIASILNMDCADGGSSQAQGKFY